MVNNYLPQLLMQTGVILKFQPPYHPQLNTCEYEQEYGIRTLVFFGNQIVKY
jgi:hypothetical protein